MLDILIRGGRVFDGFGGEPFSADLAVKGDEIVLLARGGSDDDPEAVTIIEAAGLAVAPGFIDLHCHSDFSFLLDPRADSKVRQGVTLELVGNCGSSFCAPLTGMARDLLDDRLARMGMRLKPTWTDFAGYLAALRTAGSALNVATQIGHGTIRAAVMGMAARAPDIAELSRMKALVAEALEAGALGLSSGLYYAPGSYSLAEEVFALVDEAARRGRLYSSHIRSESDGGAGLFTAVNEAIEAGRRTGARVEVSHVKANGPGMWGRAGEVVRLFERARREGVDVAGDQYPYTASSTSLTGALFPRWSLEGGRARTLERMRDAGLRAAMREAVEANIGGAQSADGVRIAGFPRRPEYEGMTLAAIASQGGVEAPEAALQIYEESEAQVVLQSMHPEDVDVIAAAPFISVASDGSSLRSEGPLSVGVPHPRSYATNARFLAVMSRARGVVPLKEAMRKMTSLPASRLGLTRRGRIAPGYAADIVLFDPRSVRDLATFDSPHQYSEGVHHVLVNGRFAVRDGLSTGETPGRVLTSPLD